MRKGTYDPPELIPYLYNGIGGQNAFDIGCSMGNTMSTLMFNYKHVFGFEPSIIPLSYLRTIPPVMGVRVFELAVSDHEGKVELNLEEGLRKVNCRSIDGLTQKLPMPDFIKVDVTGHEVEVLRGAEFTMIARPPEWLIEIYSADNSQVVQSLLTQFGYKNTIILDPNDPDPINHHWVRASMPSLDQ